MITEILGFLIIAGTILVLVVRRRMHPVEKLDVREVEDSAERLRYELEQSADEIISRMGTHMDRLEQLIAEADRRIEALDARAAARKREEEVPERADVENFSRLLRETMASAENAAMQRPQPVREMQSFQQEAVVPEEEVSQAMDAPATMERELPETNAERVRELLQQGLSNEEIAKETNMGRGAIELMRQMEKRKNEKK